MPSPFTQRLGFGSNPTASAVTIYTVPAGKHVVIRDLIVTGQSGGVIQIFVIPSTGAVYTVWNQTLANASSTHLDLRQALDVGDRLQFASSQTGTQYVATGYVFDL